MGILSKILPREEPPPPIEAFLRERHVSFSIHHHPPAYTAQEVAQAEHVPGRMVAKVVIACVDDELVMLCLPATCRVDHLKLMHLLGTDNVKLANECDFADAFPDCEVGAMPPFGNLYGMTVYVDKKLAEDERIVFQACRHTDTVEMSYEDFARLTDPIVWEFC
jgi:Ala-tRNA(Pro) deacylase